MARMTGGGALVEMLRRHGVDTLFALPGVQNDALFVALYDAGENLRVIHPRHEQAVIHAADDYGQQLAIRSYPDHADAIVHPAADRSPHLRAVRKTAPAGSTSRIEEAAL